MTQEVDGVRDKEVRSECVLHVLSDHAYFKLFTMLVLSLCGDACMHMCVHAYMLYVRVSVAEYLCVYVRVCCVRFVCVCL